MADFWRTLSPLISRMSSGVCFCWLLRLFQRQQAHDGHALQGLGYQVSHTNQVVGRAGEGEHPVNFQQSAMPHFP